MSEIFDCIRAGLITLGVILKVDDFIKGWRTAWLKDPDGNIVEVSQGYKDDDSL
jgi:glyoxylase I family protein